VGATGGTGGGTGGVGATGGTGGDAGAGGTGGTGGGTGGVGATGGTGGDAGAGGTGGDAGAGGTGGVVGDPFEATVAPVPSGNLWSLTFGNTVFEVDASVAGKIVTYSIDGTDVLVDGASQTGSVFWPSPQSLFPGNWPPPVEFDTSAFTASANGNVIEMTGPTWSTRNISATKRFWANADNQVGDHRVQHRHHGSQLSVAPWEITRVRTGGLTFFPEASTTRVTFSGQSPITLTSLLGSSWWAYADSAITAGSKIGADAGAGWAAHVHCGPSLQRTCTGDSPILIKQFADVPASQFAPGEAELELYADPDHTYVEFEIQGAYATLAAGATLTWTMHWYLRHVPSGTTMEAGSQALLDYVDSQLL